MKETIILQKRNEINKYISTILEAGQQLKKVNESVMSASKQIVHSFLELEKAEGQEKSEYDFCFNFLDNYFY